MYVSQSRDDTYKYIPICVLKVDTRITFFFKIQEDFSDHT